MEIRYGKNQRTPCDMGKIPIGCFPIEFREQGAPKLDGHFSFEQGGDFCRVTKKWAFVSCDLGDLAVCWVHSNSFDEYLLPSVPYREVRCRLWPFNE